MVDSDSVSHRGTAVILAAGASVRYGSDKRHVPFANTTLLQYTVQLYATVFHKVFVVLRTQEPSLTESFPLNSQTVIATQAQLGLSQSLRAGIQHAKSDPWVVVGLMDMPYVKSATLNGLARHMESTTASVVRLRCQKRYGNPVGFKQECFAQLSELRGDHGARSLLDSDSFSVETLEVDDRGILIDIDTPAHLKKYGSLLH
ncbi:MAG: nucleotidyltransferase family protein [Gammaproteobacteria bacterium]|nr:nucleotidyltransferase family protein [Gammaproteobacteria bacterium]MYF39128.1 nucleotidyltransferase family protein [Gammaproteobacteria bacterium]